MYVLYESAYGFKDTTTMITQHIKITTQGVYARKDFRHYGVRARPAGQVKQSLHATAAT